MSVFELARKPPQWLRVALAALMLAFALNSIAHAAHTHEQGSASTVLHSTACGYCVTFGAADAPPVHAHALPTPSCVQIGIVDRDAEFVSQRLACVAQARAPPGFLKQA